MSKDAFLQAIRAVEVGGYGMSTKEWLIIADATQHDHALGVLLGFLYGFLKGRRAEKAAVRKKTATGTVRDDNTAGCSPARQGEVTA